MPSAAVPTPEELATELARCGKGGVQPTKLPELPGLNGLALVGVLAYGSGAVDRALAVAKVIREAADNLGEGPAGEAVRLYLGLLPRSRGLRQQDRRDLAAEMIGVDAETWRRHWEKPLLLDLATEIYRMEQEARIPVRVRPRKRPEGAVLHDLRDGSGAKALDRREAEARLFSTMYAVRADLLAVARLGETVDREDDARRFADSALWRYAIFLEAMARYVDNYGAAIVMAGNEVTAREAASLLGFRLPLTDEDAVLLRLVLLADKGSGRSDFLERLRADPRASDLLARWAAAMPTSSSESS